MKTLLIAFTLVVAAQGQTGFHGSIIFDNYTGIAVANSSSGTTVNLLAKRGATANTAVVSTTSDTTGNIGCVIAGAGTTGFAWIATGGTNVLCAFDGSVTFNHYAIASVTAGGKLHDSGATTYPTSGVQVLGRILETHSGTGNYLIDMSERQESSSPVDSSGNATFAGTVTAAGFTTTGGSTAGYHAMPQGTANTPPANSVGYQAPTSVPSAYLITLPSAPAAGLARRTNATPSVESVAELSGDATTSGSNAVTVVKLNGVSLAGLATGILKNTTTTGVPSIATAADLPATTLATGTSVSLAAPREYYICTSTCTVTPPVPVAGYEFCVRNGNNISTVITMAALGSSARYENTASTAYGTAGTGTLVSGGAAGDKVCIVGLDSTHYVTMSSAGTWTAN